jgi:4-cresol dehydrogenase (hydroxylating) flavoprotein subunit
MSRKTAESVAIACPRCHPPLNNPEGPFPEPSKPRVVRRGIDPQDQTLTEVMGCLSHLRKAIGEKYVIVDPASIHNYARTTLSYSTTPAAIVKPKNREEIIEIISIANRFKVPLYPISKGKNWGYGSACAAKDGQIIVDLERMNHIIEVNEKLAYAVVEPGVTQKQLCDYLLEHEHPLWLDCSGSGPEASILGNTLERGFGHTPYGDHFMHCCGMEVVIGDGRLLKTGFGHYANAKASHVFRYGIGPYLDGLFTQSNYGIVTKLGVWLMPKPEACSMFFCSIPDEADLAAAIEALRPLKLNGVIKSLVHIGNDLRVISSFERYPWQMAGNEVPLADELRAFFRRRGRFGAWNISGAVYGTHKFVKLSRQELKKALKGIGRVRFIGHREVRLASCLSRGLEKLGLLKEHLIRLKSIEKVYGLLTGTPTDAFLFGTLWRVKAELKAGLINPLDYHAGLMWVSPILPMTGKSAQDLIRLVNPVFRQYGFEPLITVSLITERAMVSVITISFDKANPSETKRASKCYDDFYHLIMSQGYIPYRTNIHSMKRLEENSETFWDVTYEMKRVFDPNHIIAPGRYQPKEMNAFRNETAT